MAGLRWLGGLAHRVAKPLAAPKSTAGARASQAVRVARALARAQPHRSPSLLALFRRRCRLARRLHGAMCQAAKSKWSGPPLRSISAFLRPHRASLIAAPCERRDQRRCQIGPAGAVCAGAVPFATDVRFTRLPTRFEGCRTDHSRRRRRRQSMPQGPIFHVANREPRTGLPGEAARRAEPDTESGSSLRSHRGLRGAVLCLQDRRLCNTSITVSSGIRRFQALPRGGLLATLP